MMKIYQEKSPANKICLISFESLLFGEGSGLGGEKGKGENVGTV
jgi:hypothetical protein